MHLIDTHTHLYLSEFDNDRHLAVQRALENGIEKMFLPNIDSGTIDGMNQLCSEYPGVIYPMMGLHPGSVNQNYSAELEIIREHISGGGYMAVGEIGVDLYWDKTFISQQLVAFEKQIEMALEFDLPIVVHARNSFNEIFTVLDKYSGMGLRGVFHSFTGGLKEAEIILKSGFYFGINGIVTFKNAGLDAVVAQIPTNRILLETDSPYLSPVPKRGKRNESSHLVHINEFLAGLFKVSPGMFADISSANALMLFKLS